MPWQISVHEPRDSWLILDDGRDRDCSGQPACLYSVPSCWRVVATVATLREAGPVVRELRNLGHERMTIEVMKIATMPEPEPEIEEPFALAATPAPRRRR
jgi:hypothetical protein